MEKATMRKIHLIFIILLFIFFTSLEIGILYEVAFHNFDFGGILMEYTKVGSIGCGVLILFIPVSVIVIFIICKKRLSKKELFLNCICALFGIGIAIGLFCAGLENPAVRLGSQITSFLIDYFNWTEYPVLGG